MDVMGLGAFLRDRRKRLGLDLTTAAERAGMSKSHLSQIERGKIALPGPDVRRRLAEALGLTEMDLLVAAGELREERTEVDAVIDADEYRMRQALRELPHEDREVLLHIVDVFVRRHRGRFE